MAARLAILTVGILLVATGAGAQSPGAQSAGSALRGVLFNVPGPYAATGALSENSSAALYGLLLGETTTFPTGTSAGGFTWTFDDTLRVPVRRSRSFGPMFAGTSGGQAQGFGPHYARYMEQSRRIPTRKTSAHNDSE